MGDASTWIFVAVVLAVLIPLGAMIVRRMMRGELVDDGRGGPLPPPSGPGVGF